METLHTTLRHFLDQHHLSYQVKRHPPTPTSEEAAKARGGPLKIGAKALLVKDDSSFVLLVIPADKKLAAKKAKKVLGSRNLRFATPEELQQIAGVEKGAVPPFGFLFNVEMIVDHCLFQEEYLAFSAGSLEISIKMRTADYRALVKPRVEDICG